MSTLNDVLSKRPVDRANVDQHKQVMLSAVRAYKLRELREKRGLTQSVLAKEIGVSQRQISKIENGHLDTMQVSTISKYLEALGGRLSLDFIAGDTRLQVV